MGKFSRKQCLKPESLPLKFHYQSSACGYYQASLVNYDKRYILYENNEFKDQ
jgi:hypothetical protein